MGAENLADTPEGDFVRFLVSKRSTIIAYIRSVVLDQEIVEDVFQDVVVIAMDKEKPAFKDERHALNWLRKIARYQSLNVVRQKGRQEWSFGKVTMDLVDRSWDDHPSSLADSTYVNGLRHCVELLPPHTRRIVDLRYREGLGCATIAEKLGRSVNTIYVTMARVHRKLRDCINRHAARECGGI